MEKKIEKIEEPTEAEELLEMAMGGQNNKKLIVKINEIIDYLNANPKTNN